MIIVTCQIAPWDKPIEISKSSGGHSLKQNEFQIGERVVVKTEQGTDLAKIINIEEKPKELEEEETTEPESKSAQISSCVLIRKATWTDLDKVAKRSETKAQFIKECEDLIKKHKLPMKLIDVVFHFDGGRLTFAFAASSKIDFRELVKDLAQKFHKSIKLYQVGARQEVEFAGDIGPCGRSLCCLSFLTKLGNVTTELIFDQQVAHRGIDRLSGICGRLKCCLLYEEENYKELTKNLPPVGSQVNTSRGEGKVIDWHILKQTVMIEIDKDTVIEVPVQEIQNK
jgi:cell fate regulator YaaT (PSP1 superfamily)